MQQARAIAEHIRTVIGMRQALSDRASIEFATSFYDALGEGKSFEFAYELGCNAIRMFCDSDHDIPVLVTCGREESKEGATSPPALSNETSQQQQEEIPVLVDGASMSITEPCGGPLAPIPPGAYSSLHGRAREAVIRMNVIGERLGLQSVASHAAVLMQSLQQDLYRVVITGRSRAGKSTLLNALIRRRICPSNSVLTTAVPIFISPSDTKRQRCSVKYDHRESWMVP